MDPPPGERGHAASGAAEEQLVPASDLPDGFGPVVLHRLLVGRAVRAAPAQLGGVPEPGGGPAAAAAAAPQNEPLRPPRGSQVRQTQQAEL